MGPDLHLEQLERHCRLCAKVFGKQQYKYCCSNFKALLLEAFKVDVAEDQPDTHPPSFCHTCYTKARQYTKGEKHVLSALRIQEWSPHTEGSDCQVCALFVRQQRGGRPKKERKNRGRPGHSSNQILADNISQQAPPSWKASQQLAPSRFLPPASNVSLQDLQCIICKCIVDRPVETPCQKLVCSECICRHIQMAELSAVPCPCGDTTYAISSVSSSSISPPPEVVMKVLGSLLIQCDKPHCTQVVALKNLRAHVDSGCQDESATYSPSKLTVGQLLSRPLMSPPTTMEQKAATSVVKRMITASASSTASPSVESRSQLLKLPTAGKVSYGKWLLLS